MKSKTIHGVASGNHSNPNVLRAARQMRASGGSCHPMVEGDSAPPRADRPGRKAGGRVCKVDGGEVDTDQPVSKYLKGRADDERFAAKVKAAPSALGTAMAVGGGHPVVKGLGLGIAAAGAPLLKSGYENTKKAGGMEDAADKFEKTGLPGRPSYKEAIDLGSGKKNGGRAVKKD